MQTKRKWRHALSLLLALVGGGASADPNASNIQALPKTSTSHRIVATPLPAAGADNLQKPVAPEEHSFSGFYGGVQGGFGDSKTDTTYGTGAHP